MKRVFALGLMFLMVMVLCLGCTKENSSEEASITNSQSQSSAESNVNSFPQQTVSTDETASASETEEAYKKLECRTVSDNQKTTTRIIDKKARLTLEIDIPSDWVLSKVNTETFNILRNGKKIGALTTGALPAEEKFEYKYTSNYTKATDVDWYIAKRKENGQEKFYRVFCLKGYYHDDEYSMILSVDYTELDTSASTSMAYNAQTLIPERDLLPLSETNGSKKILILGNSFIGSSDIGDFLSDMLRTANNGYSVEAISIGMAEINTYVAHDFISNSIRNGEYCYVFQCGFYSSRAVDDFGNMKSICDESNTPIVIFPAHNENATLVTKTFDSYRDVPLLNWKGKVQSLIDDGVAYSDMCIDDYHKHSTSLAGYVGACMIYKKVFGENPPAITSQAPLTQQYVDSKLGAYKDTLYSMDNFSGRSYEIN